MPKRTAVYREGLLARLADPEWAAHYVQAALEDSNEAFLVALRDVAEANQMAKVAKDAGVAREALYRMLSESGNPTFNKLRAVLARLGLAIEVVAAHPTTATAEPHATTQDHKGKSATNHSLATQKSPRPIRQ